MYIGSVGEELRRPHSHITWSRAIDYVSVSARPRGTTISTTVVAAILRRYSLSLILSVLIYRGTGPLYSYTRAILELFIEYLTALSNNRRCKQTLILWERNTKKFCFEAESYSCTIHNYLVLLFDEHLTCHLCTCRNVIQSVEWTIHISLLPLNTR